MDTIEARRAYLYPRICNRSYVLVLRYVVTFGLFTKQKFTYL